MMFESMGLDPVKLEANMENAIAHVQAISERLERMENLQKLIGQSCVDNAAVVVRVEAAQIATRDTTVAMYSMLQGVQMGVNESCKIGLRLEDAIDHLRTGAPPNSNGFIEHFNESLRDSDSRIASDAKTEAINGAEENGRRDETTDTTSNTI